MYGLLLFPNIKIHSMIQEFVYGVFRELSNDTLVAKVYNKLINREWDTHTRARTHTRAHTHAHTHTHTLGTKVASRN